MKPPKLKDLWPTYRSLLKSFYIAIEQQRKPNGSSPYNTGYNDALKAVERASEIWFKRMSELN